MIRSRFIAAGFALGLAFTVLPPVHAASNTDITLTPGTGGSVRLNDGAGKTQLKVNANGVRLQKIGNGTATGLCLDASNHVVTCGRVFMSSAQDAGVGTDASGNATAPAILPLSGWIGVSVPNGSFSGADINLDSGGQTILAPNTIPSAGTFTTMDATLFINGAYNGSTPNDFSGTSVTVTAQLYTGTPGAATLSPVPGAACSFPAFTGATPNGTSRTCHLTGLSVPYAAGTAAVVGIYAQATTAITATLDLAVSVSVGS